MDSSGDTKRAQQRNTSVFVAQKCLSNPLLEAGGHARVRPRHKSGRRVRFGGPSLGLVEIDVFLGGSPNKLAAFGPPQLTSACLTAVAGRALIVGGLEMSIHQFICS